MPASYAKNSRNHDCRILAERRVTTRASLCRSRSISRFPRLLSLFFFLASTPGLAQSQPVNVVFIMTND